MTQTQSHRESDANYHGVIAALNDRWRVIACRDGIQWILQFSKKSRDGVKWYSRSYCRTRQALIRDASLHAGDISPIAMTVLNNLPERLS